MAKGMLLVSMAIVLIHSFVPHQHDTHAGRVVISLQTEESPSDLLASLFAFNPGIDHLDHYSVADNLSLEFTCVSEHIPNPLPLAAEETIKPFDDYQKTGRPDSVPPVRGSPLS